MPQRISLDQLNALSNKEFQATIAPVFEKSTWIAKAVSSRRPFQTAKDLLRAITAEVEHAGPGALLRLIRAHPDLGARIHERAALTGESQAEQNQAGLFGMTPDEEEQFLELNRSYKNKFGFPFILCARMHTRESILASFRARLDRDPEAETAEAWVQIQNIAALRLYDIVEAV